MHLVALSVVNQRTARIKTQKCSVDMELTLLHKLCDASVGSVAKTFWSASFYCG